MAETVSEVRVAATQTQGTIVTSNVVFTARNSGQISGYVAAVNTAPPAILAASSDPTVQVNYTRLSTLTHAPI